MGCNEGLKRRVRTGDGAERATEHMKAGKKEGKERRKGKGWKSEKKVETDRPCKWKGMGSRSPSLVLLANFSCIQ